MARHVGIDRQRDRSDQSPLDRGASASDALVTKDAYKIEPGWACRAEPGSGVGGYPPNPAPFPPFRGCVAPSAGLRLLLRIVLRLAVPKVRKTEAVAVLRFREGEGGAGL